MEIKKEMLDFSRTDKRILHLSEEEIVKVIQEYYEGVVVGKLKERYKIQVTNSQFYKVFPPKKTEVLCLYCGISCIIDWPSKSVYSFAGNKHSYCPSCNHVNRDYCRCHNCERIRLEQEEAERKWKREAIYNKYKVGNFQKLDEVDLSLEDRLYLATLLRTGLAEDLKYIMPLQLSTQKLTPYSEFTNEVIKTLTGRGIISPHEDSDFGAFLDEEFPTTYYIYEVMYRININPIDGQYEKMIQRLLYPSTELFEQDEEFCYLMWKKISLYECLEYLLFSMEKVGFEFNPGSKTYKVFEHLLDHFSVAQIYSIIYRAIANSTKLYQEREVTKKHAANAVITSCESQGERAIAEGWDLRKYRRNYDLPESVISKTFFTSILKIAYLGFEEKPTVNI